MVRGGFPSRTRDHCERVKEGVRDFKIVKGQTKIRDTTKKVEEIMIKKCSVQKKTQWMTPKKKVYPGTHCVMLLQPPFLISYYRSKTRNRWGTSHYCN